MHPRRTLSYTSLAVALAAVLFTGTRIAASGQQETSLEERASGAESVVVARAERVSPAWKQNAYGDRLIVSRVLLRVEETLKGAPAATTWLEVEGGTLDGQTLHVSDEPGITPGERGVFFLDAGSPGMTKPHLRGEGILKLDENDTVKGTRIHLNDVRKAAKRGEN